MKLIIKTIGFLFLTSVLSEPEGTLISSINETFIGDCGPTDANQPVDFLILGLTCTDECRIRPDGEIKYVILFQPPEDMCQLSQSLHLEEDGDSSNTQDVDLPQNGCDLLDEDKCPIHAGEMTLYEITTTLGDELKDKSAIATFSLLNPSKDNEPIFCFRHAVLVTDDLE